MGMLSVDTIFGGGAQAGGEDVARGYENAINYMKPYYEGGVEDYSRYRGEVGKQGELLDKYGNPADYIWKNAALSPEQSYQNMMSGYMMSPEARYQTEQMQKAADRGASSSGMLGSGSYFDALQRNQQSIVAQDQDRWFRNLLGMGEQQLQQLGNFQGQQRDYRDRLNGLANMGFNAANIMGQNAVGQGQGKAMADMGEAAGWQNLIGYGLGMDPLGLSHGGSSGMNPFSSGGGGSGGDSGGGGGSGGGDSGGGSGDMMSTMMQLAPLALAFL